MMAEDSIFSHKWNLSRPDSNPSYSVGACRKAYSLAPLILLLPILMSCSKDADVPACQQDRIQINANISIIAEDTSSRAVQETIDFIDEPVLTMVLWFIHRPFGDYFEMVESLLFSRLPNQTGTYNLADTNQLGVKFGRYGHTIDRDIAGYEYEAMDDQDSYLEIISLDTVNHRIHARFEAHFRRTYEGPWTYDFPEEVHFTDCEFCLEYEEQ